MGMLVQAVTNLAYETRALIAVEKFRTLNRCLDSAIAGAVAEFSIQQTASAAEEGICVVSARLGPLAHELRNYLLIAMHAVKALKTGSVGLFRVSGAYLQLTCQNTPRRRWITTIAPLPKNSPLLHYTQLHMSVRDGTVTISGKVNSLAQRKAAERAANRVPGVKTLILEIGAAAIPMTVSNIQLDTQEIFGN